MRNTPTNTQIPLHYNQMQLIITYSIIIIMKDEIYVMIYPKGLHEHVT